MYHAGDRASAIEQVAAARADRRHARSRFFTRPRRTGEGFATTGRKSWPSSRCQGNVRRSRCSRKAHLKGDRARAYDFYRSRSIRRDRPDLARAPLPAANRAGKPPPRSAGGATAKVLLDHQRADECQGPRRRAGLGDVSVCCSGASGTRQGIACPAVHDKSPRAKGEVIAIQTAPRFPENLLEAELVRLRTRRIHRRGSMTTAQDRAGPGRHTWFLDEVGTVRLHSRSNCCAAVQDACDRADGGPHANRGSTRIVARPPESRAMTAAGSFREDYTTASRNRVKLSCRAAGARCCFARHSVTRFARD